MASERPPRAWTGAAGTVRLPLTLAAFKHTSQQTSKHRQIKALVAHARTSRSQTRHPHFILRSAYKLPANFQPQRCRRRSARSNTSTMASKLAGGEVVLDHGTFKANQPPLAPKRKLKIDRKKSDVEWQWAPFTNQAREDGLISAF